MKYSNIILSIFSLYIMVGSYAQEVKFGKVSREELEEKFNPLDTSATASFLYKYRKTSFDYINGEGFQLNTEIHERIKIYDQAGFDYATKKIKLYKDGSTKENLQSLKAITYNLENDKVVETKLGKDGEFSSELSKNWDEESFTMPNLKVGSVIEYSYRIVSPFVSNVDEFVFQQDIPIKYLEAIMDAPEYFNFRMNSKGFLNIVPDFERKNNSLNLQQRVTQNFGNTLGGGVTTKQEKSTIDYVSNVSNYKLINVPALREEPFVNGIDNYRAGMKYELNYVALPNTPIKQYATSWEAVVKAIYDSPNFGDELRRTGYYENDIDAVVSSLKGDQEKVMAVFNFVKSKVKWNGFYDKYANEGVKNAYLNHKGNIAEINLMLTSMLRYIGLDANPVLVSTRENGIPIFPTREGYNYVIAGVKLGDGIVLLDASHPYSSPNILPLRTLNWEGRLIQKDGSSSIVRLFPMANSLKKVFCNTSVADSGTIQGKIRVAYYDHDAISFRENLKRENREDFLRSLESKNGDIEIDNFEVKNEDDLSKSVIASYDYYKENGVDIIADKMYFSPLLFFALSENPFKLEEREFPVDFGFPYSQDYVSSIEIPAGYKIDGLPEPLAIALPDGLGSFTFEILNKEAVVQAKVVIEINESIIPANYYPTLKEFYKKMIEKMNEKVVLSKITTDGNSAGTTKGR